MHSFRSIAAKANANHIVGHKIESRRKPAAFGPHMWRLEPFGLIGALATIAAMLMVPPVTAIELTSHGAHGSAAIQATAHPHQRRQTALLAIIKALVEWVRGIGDLLQAGGAFSHGVGALMQAIDEVGSRA
jgi:hypothetical protein